MLEKILVSSLQHLCKSIISPSQHGFVKGRSTTTNLLEFTSLVNDAFSEKKQTDVIYTDFSKAFDSVNHDLLLTKLDRIGFPPAFLGWISTYLKGRTQKVLLRSSISNSFYVTSGVPQGSHLGPLLFTLFINDLPNTLSHSSILMYADDVKLVFSYTDPLLHNCLQDDLNAMQHWCSANQLHLNFSKCMFMTFSRTRPFLAVYMIDSTPLQRITTVKDLGVLFDCKLNFNLHISTIVNEAKGVLGFIKRWSKEFSDPFTTKLLYTSLVRPILEYCSCIWSPQYHINQDRIESVQKQFLLFALRGLNWDPDFRLPSYSSRLLLLSLPSLINRRITLGVTFLHKLIIGEIDSIFLLERLSFSVPRRTTRNFIPLALPTCTTDYALHSSFRVLCAEYNNLCQVFSTELSSLPEIFPSPLPFQKSLTLLISNTCIIPNYCY